MTKLNDPRGHRAASRRPRCRGQGGRTFARGTYKRTWDDNVALVAAGVAFYGFFALLSLLGLIVITYGFVADPKTVIDHMGKLTAVLPSDIAVLIGDQLLRAVDASKDKGPCVAAGRRCRILRRHERGGVSDDGA